MKTEKGRIIYNWTDVHEAEFIQRSDPKDGDPSCIFRQGMVHRAMPSGF